ncbi:unnamed protein product [Schistocephalus solidus]|uniref:Uncharacterized protein n=1 Tax=Schistocephalus solidus TaxID=70667 RepID=A0A183SBU1_SCHSO|nr:unnamed protein product [Schistocephalus solidus]
MGSNSKWCSAGFSLRSSPVPHIKDCTDRHDCDAIMFADYIKIWKTISIVNDVGHLRIHRTETGELVHGASITSSDSHPQFPHCPRARTYRMRLIDHMRIQESGIHCDANTSNTCCAPINTSHSPPMSATTNTSTGAPPYPRIRTAQTYRA